MAVNYNPPWIEIVAKAKQRRERKLGNEVGHAIHTVILHGLAPHDSSKILIRRVPLRFSDAAILADLDESQFETYTYRELCEFKLIILTFFGLKGHTGEPLCTIGGGSYVTAAPGCPKRFREPCVLSSRDARRRSEPRGETRLYNGGHRRTAPDLDPEEAQ
ncbi:hypothetical protein IscW_ISCW017849 [Ixodes scapularis]|uniref:Uncharacterized protein n=1 Tax=Ixodes scapularis TaxID=6945 RepID=B7PIP5_IXOSC|nr:hypothetical protein IscW_ISCW017849 [Ixodes scapularis]|eukprot:XP_002405644.1 hypothetical protein IscW_ISCW017849 [Ixodes scapularis]